MLLRLTHYLSLVSSHLFFLSLLTPSYLLFFFFFNDTATTEIYPLSLHDALPICHLARHVLRHLDVTCARLLRLGELEGRSEEHTSELQSLRHLVCRLLLEKKTKTSNLVPDKSIY